MRAREAPAPMEVVDRASAVGRLAEAKQQSGKSYTEIAAETGLTNVYVAQLLRRQAQLKPDTAPKLRKAIPALTDELVNLMMAPPFRSYHPDIIQEPSIYRYLPLKFVSRGIYLGYANMDYGVGLPPG